MTHYRLYVFDAANHIRQAIDLECTDDDEARLRATSYVDGNAVEVWQSTRRVARLAAAEVRKVEFQPARVDR